MQASVLAFLQINVYARIETNCAAARFLRLNREIDQHQLKSKNTPQIENILKINILKKQGR